MEAEVRALAPDPGDVGAAEVVGVFAVVNQHGLHARPAARLVSEVRTLDASVQLRNLQDRPLSTRVGGSVEDRLEQREEAELGRRGSDVHHHRHHEEPGRRRGGGDELRPGILAGGRAY